MKRLLVLAVLGISLGTARTVSAAPIVFNFDSFADLTTLTNQIAGLTFIDATVLTSGAVGGSLNEFDFPPLSGDNVIFDSDGPMRIDFDSPVFGFGGYFTYLAPVTLTAFGAGGVPLGFVSSLGTTNVASSSTPGPNELLQFFATDISYVTITGDTLGGSFTLDDAFIEPANGGPAPVPEPTTLVLLGSGVALASLRRRSRGDVR
jgi:hypothetical protein